VAGVWAAGFTTEDTEIRKAVGMVDENREDLKKLVGKLLNVMAACKHMTRSGRHQTHGFAYSTETDLLNTVRDALLEHRIFPLVSQAGSSTRVLREAYAADVKPVTVTVVPVDITFFDCDTGASIAIRSEGESPNEQGQAISGAVTGAVKVALQKMFLIPRDDPVPGTVPPVARAPARQDGGEAPKRNPAKNDEPISGPQLKYLENLLKQAGVSADKICEAYSINTLAELRRGTWYDEVQPRLKAKIDEKKGG